MRDIALTERKLIDTVKGSGSLITRFAWSPNGQKIAFASDDKTITIVDERYETPDTFASPYATTKNLKWSPDGLSVAVSSIYDTIYLIDTRSGIPSGKINGRSGWITSLSWSPDARSIVSTCPDAIIRIWYVQNYLLVEELRGHTNVIQSVIWSPDGKWIASSSSAGNIRIWNTETWKLELMLKGHSESVDSMAFTADSQIIASASVDGTVMAWDVETGNSIKSHNAGQKNISCLSFSSDGNLLASMDEQGTVCLRSCDTWDVVDTFNEPTRGRLRGGVEFHPSKPLLAVISQKKGEINLYDVGAFIPTDETPPSTTDVTGTVPDTAAETNSNQKGNEQPAAQTTIDDTCANGTDNNGLPAETADTRTHDGVTDSVPDKDGIQAARPNSELPVVAPETGGQRHAPHAPRTGLASDAINLEILRSADMMRQSAMNTANAAATRPLPISHPHDTQGTSTATGRVRNRQTLSTWAGSPKCTLALIFTDIVGSTSLCNNIGNEAFIKACQAHFMQARQLLKKYNGYEIKTIGDAVMAAFRTVPEVLDFGMELRKHPGDKRISIRAGIHVGPVTITQNDAYGTAVNYAARIGSIAQGAEIWISDEAKRHVDQEGLSRHTNLKWLSHSDCELKGFHETKTLWSIGE